MKPNTNQTSKQIFEKLNAESVIPMLLDDGTAYTVSQMAGGLGFPEYIYLLIERPGQDPEERRYTLDNSVEKYTDSDSMK